MNNMHLRSLTGFGFFTLALFMTDRAALASTINSDVALTPSEGTTIVRTQARYSRSSDDPSGMGRTRDKVVWSNTAVYGVTGNFALAINVPLVDLRVDSPGGVLVDETGLGDVTLMGKYRFWQHDEKGSTDRIAGIFGLEIPSGRDALSSNSLDPILGLVYTHQGMNESGLLWEVDADVVYKVNTEARDTDLGDTLRYDLAVGHQIWPWKTADKLLVGVLELNGVYNDRDIVSGIEVPDSGGHILYLSPGLQFVTMRYVIEAGVKIPIVQDLYGPQLEEDVSVSLGLRIQF